ncbi:MAG: efflux RND transporter permease subunit [Myxococcota bacterium]|nr:efflux RND transporter permease subunit [Myxococcota bacterium]
MSLPRFSVRQVVLVNLLFVVLIVAGLLSAARTPLDLFPDVSFNQAMVLTVWSGASAEDVEKLVTTRLEDEIRKVTGIKKSSSFSSQGLSEISIEWDEDLSEVEQQSRLNDLRGAIERTTELPADAEEPILRELSMAEVQNTAMVALSDVGGVGEFALREVARDLARKLERVPGIRKAEPRGERARELRVLVDKNRALQYDLTLSEISDIIRRNNRNVPGGTFETVGAEEISVRGLGNFQSAADLADTVVGKNGDGTHIRLSDVADVEPGFARRKAIGRFNGHPTITIGIAKYKEDDTVEVLDAVKAAIDATRLPQGVEAQITFDSSIYIGGMVELLRNNLLLGVAFVVLILWFTVGFRNSMLAIVGVPFSFLAAIILFPIFDLTISTMALFGFIMVSGMLVDDAIIVIENIYRHIESGEPLVEAVVNGTEEVMWPVIAAVATTVAAFLPMLLIPGAMGQFMSVLPKTVIACLIASLVEVLIVLPAHYIDWGSRRGAEDSPVSEKGRISRLSHDVRRRVDGAISALRDRYLWAQGRLLKQRGAFLLFCIAAFYGAIELQSHVDVDIFPGGFNQIFVTVIAPVDYGLEPTNQVVEGVESALESIAHEFTDIATTVGQGMTAEGRSIAGSNRATIFLAFPNTSENLEDPERVLQVVQRTLEGYRHANPEGIETLLVTPPMRGPGVGQAVAIRVHASQYDVAKEIAEEAKAALRSLPGVYNVEDNIPLGPRELRVRLDENRASIHGLSFEDVGFALRASNEGLVPSTFKDPTSNEDIDIRVVLKKGQRRSIEDLLDTDLRTPAGYLVKLEDVAEIELARSYARLYHRDTDRAVIVYAAVDRAQTSAVKVNEAMQQRLGDVESRYPGVNIVFGGEFEATQRAFADIARAALIALLAIYAILAAAFRSYAQPVVVMSVVALSYIGVVLGMFIMGYPISMFVLYALVGLAGVVVNDSLVLIDFVNRERARGSDLQAAIRSASSHRFRPILLTTLTTIGGLLPMAIGLSGGSSTFGPFAAAIVFGLAVASTLTLFVVPALYLVLEDFQAWIVSLIRSNRRADGSVSGGPRTA